MCVGWFLIEKEQSVAATKNDAKIRVSSHEPETDNELKMHHQMQIKKGRKREEKRKEKKRKEKGLKKRGNERERTT